MARNKIIVFGVLILTVFISTSCVSSGTVARTLVNRGDAMMANDEAVWETIFTRKNKTEIYSTADEKNVSAVLCSFSPRVYEVRFFSAYSGYMDAGSSTKLTFLIINPAEDPDVIMYFEFGSTIGSYYYRSPSPLVVLNQSGDVSGIEKTIEKSASGDTGKSLQAIQKNKTKKTIVTEADAFTIHSNTYGVPVEVVANKDFTIQSLDHEGRSFSIPAGARFDLTRHGKSDIDFALMYEPARIREMLDEELFYINRTDEDGFTPLMVSLFYGHSENARIMIDKGAYINASNPANWTPLMYALRYDTPENAKLLIEKGADVNAQTNYGWTPLMFALRNGKPEIASLLITNGAEINTKNDNGWTPLMFALVNGHPDIAQLLLDKGAQVNVKNDNKWTPLMQACRYSTPEVVEIIAKKTKDIGAETGNGNSALHLALYNDNTANIGEIIRILKDNGADLNKENDDDLTAHGLAVKLDMPQDILNLLQ